MIDDILALVVGYLTIGFVQHSVSTGFDLVISPATGSKNQGLYYFDKFFRELLLWWWEYIKSVSQLLSGKLHWKMALPEFITRTAGILVGFWFAELVVIKYVL